MKPQVIKKLLLSTVEDDVLLGIEYMRKASLETIKRIITKEGSAAGGPIPMYYTFKYTQEISKYTKGKYIFRNGFMLFYHSTHIMYCLNRDMLIQLKAHGYEREYLSTKKWNFKPQNK